MAPRAGIASANGSVVPPQVPLSRQPVLDLVVAMVAVPLLVVFGLMLESNMRGNWVSDSDMRWNVLGLGLALLFVSLVVCCYVTHRLGICIWSAHNRQHQARHSATGRNNQGGCTSVSSQLHLVSELPPSYDAVVAYDMPPPPYCMLSLYDQKPPATPPLQPPPQPPPQQTPPPPQQPPQPPPRRAHLQQQPPPPPARPAPVHITFPAPANG